MFRLYGERQALAHVGHVQVRIVTEPSPGQRQHPGTGVDTGDDGNAVAGPAKYAFWRLFSVSAVYASAKLS